MLGKKQRVLVLAGMLSSCGSLDDPFMGALEHAFSAVEQQKVKSLKLLGLEAQDVANEIQELIQAWESNASIQVQSSSFNDQVRFQFLLNGVEYCHEQGFIRKDPQGDFQLLMHRPRQIPDRRTPPDREESARFIAKSLPDYRVVENLRHCFLDLGEDSLSVSVYEWVVRSTSGTYLVRADETTIYEFAPQYFSATAKVRAYNTNPVSGSLTDFSILVDESGYLENSTFKTRVGSGSRAYSSDFQFVYEPSNNSFKEASAFAHANTQLDFFKTLGFTFSGQVIEVAINQVIGGTPNNALYTPSATSNPKIEIGDGDGQVLKNLAVDSAVVSHELGHHVVFQSLKSTVNQSLVIHEGLADYFALTAADDPCLGRSVCPAGSTLCEVADQCLRTADNNYVLGVNVSSQPHKASQFISGLLWDLRGADIPVEALDRIVYKGTTLLLTSSGYYDLVLGWMLADDELYDKQYCSAILAAAKKRGLSQTIADLSCESELPSLLASTNPTVPGTSSKKSSGGGGCTVGQSRDPLSLLWMMLPFFARLRSRFFIRKSSYARN